ncbi:hypothetical protein [Afipia clevelandensis]|uniref:hypothetical protein n=1 Tax=Afipia clevelandensis TaxID=1034 RepID=UPI0012F65FA5|nr:hypothetical protein [Afipia clevelandensis]
MSADIADISLIADMSPIFAAGISLAAAGVASGEATSPMIAKTANKRLMNRHKFITQHPIGSWIWEGRSHHKSAIGGKRSDNSYLRHG